MKKQAKEKPLPLFEYAKRYYEEFSSFEDYDHYFAYCIQTSGFKMHVIAEWLGISDTALSIRLNTVDPDQPRFNTKLQDRYVSHSGDPRPGEYLQWRAKQKQSSDQEVMAERVSRLIPHVEGIRALLNFLEGK